MLARLFVLTPHYRTVGNTAEEIYYGLIHARRTGRKLLLLRPLRVFGHPQISNRELFELVSPEIAGKPLSWLRPLGNLVCTGLFFHLRAAMRYIGANLSQVARFASSGARPRYQAYRGILPDIVVGTERLWNPQGLKKFDWGAAESLQWADEFARPIPVEIEPRKAVLVKTRLREMGIPEGAWHVCLHVREAGYHGDADAPRNSDIQNTLLAIEAITSRGGWVVRMGDRSMKRLPAMPQVIDYPFTEFKSELMDVYLIQSCRMFMGQNSGIVDIAQLFGKKCVIFNATEWTFQPLPQKGSLTIMKHVFSKKLGRYLSLRELMDEPFSWQDLLAFDGNYTFRENSAEEIRDVVLESLGQDDAYEYTAMQRDFIRKRREMIQRWLEKPLWPVESWDRHGKFRIASRSTQSNGTLGRKFLQENWEKSSLGELAKATEKC